MSNDKVLELITRIHSMRHSSNIKNLDKVFKTDILLWLAKEIDCCEIIINFYSIDMSTIRRQKIDIYHIDTESKEYKGVSSTKCNMNIEISKKVIMYIGFVEFIKEGLINQKQRDVLDTVIPFISDFYYDGIKKVLSNKIKQAYSYITIINRRKKAGSIICKNIQILHKTIGAYKSFFCIVNNLTATIEYYKTSRSGFPYYKEQKESFTLLKDLNNTILKTMFFEWKERGEKEYLRDIFKEYIAEYDFNTRIFIYVYYHDDKPIALYIFFISISHIIDIQEIISLFKFCFSNSNAEIQLLFQRRCDKMIIDPIFKIKDTLIINDQVFILMPFSLEWSDRIWLKILKPSIEECGLKPIRADNLYGRDIMEDIWKTIVNSKIIIADITGRNPNVFYELGIAHTLGKTVILITQNEDDIPFDLNRYRHIIYKDNIEGCEILFTELKKSIQNIID